MSSVLTREMLERSWGSFSLVSVLVAMFARRRDRARVLKEGNEIGESILEKV